MASPSAYLLSLHQSPLQNGGLQRKDCSSCQRRAPNLTVHKLSTNQQLITDPFIYSLPSTAVLAGTTPASMSFRLRCTVATNRAELFFTKQRPRQLGLESENTINKRHQTRTSPCEVNIFYSIGGAPSSNTWQAIPAEQNKSLKNTTHPNLYRTAPRGSYKQKPVSQMAEKVVGLKRG